MSEDQLWTLVFDFNLPVTPFSMIHVVNSVSLGYMFVGLVGLHKGSILAGLFWNQPADSSLYLIVVAFGLLVILPILEVNGYGEADTYGIWPLPGSYMSHLFGVLGLLMLVTIRHLARPNQPKIESLSSLPSTYVDWVSSNPALLLFGILAFVGVGMYFVGIIAFVSGVHSEMSRVYISEDS